MEIGKAQETGNCTRSKRDARERRPAKPGTRRMKGMATCATFRPVRASRIRSVRLETSCLRLRTVPTAQSSVDPKASKVTTRRAWICRSTSSSQEEPLPIEVDKKTGFNRFVDVLTTMFPVWVFLGASIGIARPAMVTWLSSDLFTLGLGFLMLSMGLTLTFDDFKKCFRNPATVGVGFLAQYIIKPVLGATIAKLLNLSPPLATGLVLVSCCPGGQASNVATYIAHGNVALSVLMTTASTIAAIFMTPLLTKLLAGQLVPVDAAGLALSTFQVVLVPTLIGVLANEFFPKVVKKITPVLPLMGVLITTMLCASPVGQVSAVLKAQGSQLLLPVGILHVAAFALGYFISKAVGFSETTARTVSIETGMQSAALGFLLAQQHFADPMVAVPSAVSVVFMALGGAALAVYWRGKPVVGEKDDFIA